MRKYSQGMKFEKAAQERDRLIALESLYGGQEKEHFLLAAKRVLNLRSLPLCIEGIDISTISGQEACGSVVVFKDGRADKASYRRYRIREANRQDDYAMMQEVVRRRYARLLREKRRMPDLIIIDGGKGHLDAARQILISLSIETPIIGIAKRHEEIWMPHHKAPLVLAKENPCLQLIQRVRDEAHRFAHAYHRSLRKKKAVGRRLRHGND